MNHRMEPSEMDKYFTPEIRGVISYGLSQDDIDTANFGEHTLYGIDELLIQEKAENHQEAFEILRELNEEQVNGIVKFKLSRDQVLSPNFGEHTLQFIYQKQRKKAKEHQEQDFDQEQAFDLVEGLSRNQIYAINHYDLNKLDVRNLNVEPDTLDAAMEALKALNTNASDRDLYEIVSNMSESQLNGIAEKKLSLKQVGIDFVDGKFKKQNNQVSVAPVETKKNNEETKISSQSLEALRKPQNLKPSSSDRSSSSSSDESKPAAKREHVRPTTPANDNSRESTTNKKSRKKGMK